MIRPRLTFSNVVACTALFIALGGASYAAIMVPRNSVGAAQIKTGAITSNKVKDHSLLAVDFKSGQLPKGATGPAGPTGPAGASGAAGAAGAPGSAIGYAHLIVSGAGVTVDATRSKNVTQANVTHPATGVVCFSGLSFTPRNIVGSDDANVTGAILVNGALAPDAAVSFVCGATGQAAIQIENTTPANVDHDVYVTFN